jgi:phosphoribosylformylglycinamidine synthase
LQRDPTDLELETLAQTWSEHCVHKTLKSAVDYVGDDFGKPGVTTARFENLLKETIASATRRLDRDWCLSVFVDNAGVIAFDDEFGVAFKVETHNHPSAIEPYGGAATGVGGCIRDIMGCGLGAKPIASTDVFCLAPPDFDASRVPQGVLHPRRVLKGVVGGVRDYGNRMGIPTVNGAIHFDERYLANPLVYCGCVGLIPRNRIHKAAQPGDAIVVAGGRTGRDGIHGATFSSAELTDTHADVFSHAVQIGNAIQEKTLLDALLIARDHAGGCLFSAVTDCGAGGLSSAVGEMGAETGARVDLEKVPLKYSGLRYDEIWISEAQERMVFAVSPDRLAAFMQVFATEEVEATVIGEFTGDHTLTVRFNGTTVGELSMAFLHDGLPRTSRKATWRKGRTESASPHSGGERPSGESLFHQLPLALADLNTASKEWVIRQYDHEVQGRSVIKPLVGTNAGPSDAAVLRPRYESYRGIAVACGLCPEGAGGDPYWMAIRAVDEALRNVICVGTDPDRTAILDNFCWPKCDNEESMGALVRACKGCCDAAIAYGLPFISGKDSLNNEFTMNPAEAKRTGQPERIAIPYTLLISAIGIVPDVRRCVTMDLKSAGNALVLAYAPVDRAGLGEAYQLHRRVASLIAEGGVRAAHDVSDGGLLVAIAEMCIASGLGASVKLDVAVAFEVSATTYVLEMSDAEATKSGFPRLGRVESSPTLRVTSGGERVEWSLEQLAAAWRAPLASGGGHS